MEIGEEMKNSMILFLVMCATIFAQGADHILMINTEYAFAQAAIRDGVRQSFLNFIADDGILFRPHPLKGKEFLEKSKSGSGYLFWYPGRSAISAAGDMGYTTGPWSFRKEKDSLETGFGEFCTVWEKRKDSTFKFDINNGISHGKPVEIQTPIHFGKTIYYYSRVWLLKNAAWEIIAEVWNEKPKEKTN